MCKEIAEDVTRGPKHDAGEETIHVEMQNLMPTRDDDVSDDGWTGLRFKKFMYRNIFMVLTYDVIY